MVVENCLQLSTYAASVGTVAVKLSHNAHHLPPSKLNLSTLHGPKKSFPAISSSSFVLSRKSQKHNVICKASEATKQVEDVNESTWNELVIESQLPVMVDFWAPWCGPCKLIAPVVDELAKEYSGKLAVYKVNTDECPNIASKFSIRSIPTVLFFKNGERKESIIGAVPRTTLSDTIEKYLS